MVRILDSSAWVEFFVGAEKGKIVESLIRNEEAFTCIATLAEIVNWAFKNNLQHMVVPYLDSIKSGSKILDLDEQVVMLAGGLNHERKKKFNKWGMMDSFILATSLLNKLKILTKDNDFKDLPNAEML